MAASLDRSANRVEMIELDRLALREFGSDSAAIEIILITVHDGNGLTGYGELAPAHGRMALARAMAASAVGRDPCQLPPLRSQWIAAGPASEVRMVAGGIETALADLQARQAGLPLFAMLGGRRTDRIPLVRRLDASDPATAAVRANELGVATFLVTGGGQDRTITSLRALRERLGPEVNLRLDCGGQGAALVRACGDLWLEMIIDPAATLGGLTRLREHPAIPVALARPVTDVAGLAHAIQAEAIDIWIVDPLDLGGPNALQRGAALCRTFGIDLALDAHGRSEIGAALALHLCVAHRVINRAVELSPALSEGSGMLAAGLRIESGHVVVPDGPGLGVEPDPAMLEACRIENTEVEA